MAAIKTTKPASPATKKTEPIADIDGNLHVAAGNALTDLHTERRLEAGGRRDFSALYSYVAPSEEAAVTTHDLLTKAMEQLPPEQLQALSLAMIDGLTHQEIATAMNISPRRVRALLARALMHCLEVVQAAGDAR